MEFDAARRELIEAVLEPLPDRQKKARQALEIAVAGAAELIGPAGEQQIPALAARMRKSAPRFMATRKWRALAVAAVMAIVLSLSLLRPQAWKNLNRMILAVKAEAGWSYLDEAESPPYFWPFGLEYQKVQSSVVADQAQRMPHTRFLVNTSPADRSETLRHWKGVWDAFPRDPALFFVYSMAYLKEQRTLPPDFVATGESLDPGNGWFRFCSAAISSGEVLERDNRRQKFLVKDPVKLQAVLEELERASQMPRWDDYRSRLFQMAGADWPVPDDLPDQVFSHGTFQDIPMAMEDYPLLQLRAALGIWLEAAGSAPDPAVLGAAAVRFEALCRHWSACECGYTGREWQRQATQKGAEVLAAADAAGRDVAEQTKYAGIAAAMAHAAPQGYQWTYHDQAGILTRGNSGAFDRPAIITPDDVRPGRLAEYVMWERLFFQCLAAALALLVLICLFLPQTERKRLDFLPERLIGSLTLRDRLLAGLTGIGVPVAVYLLTRNSGLDPRDQFLSESRCAMLLCQIAALAVSSVLLIGSVLALSLRKKAAAVSFQRGGFGISLGLAITTLGTIPLAAWLPREFIRQKLEGAYAYQCIGLMACLPFLWLVVHAAGWRFSPFECRLPRLTLIRACAPLFGVMAMGSLVAVEMLHREEQALVRQMAFESVHSLQRGCISPGHLAEAEQIRTTLQQQFKP